MPWNARLQIDYTLHQGKTRAHHQHVGPLRILQSLYPEGDRVCHNVLVHPPGGLVGGDTLDLEVSVGPQAHGLLTTPGATRFYRSAAEPARQNTYLRLAAGARLEWLPLEAICYNDCRAENSVHMALEPGAELMGWDLSALGLPHADLPFEQGYLQQHLAWPGVWLERARIAADDVRLLGSPAGMAGKRCLGTLYLAVADGLGRARREQALDSARERIAVHRLAASAGATSPNAQVVLVRVLADQVEPAMDLLRQVRLAWRQALWGMAATSPRIWAM